MLSALRKVVQEVNAAASLEQALWLIVQRVRLEMSTQVCSIYLLDTASQRYILMATEGLNRESVGKVNRGRALSLFSGHAYYSSRQGAGGAGRSTDGRATV